jgi:hypothetical protein
MGTTSRRGIPQKISKERMRGKGFEKKEPGFLKRKALLFIASIMSIFARGDVGIHIEGKVPSISCACGCGKKSFAATYYNLTHAVLHKRELSIQ